MSLLINNLTKVYGHQKALDSISFSVKAGELVGFLGPNGAGKSTTMKIATGFLAPTSGNVTLGGFDVAENPLEVKRITGYLPEHNPLYLDMYVHEYLLFVGGLYGLRGGLLKNRVSGIVELCGLGQEQNKKLEALSKGYRQRAGLAQALLHDPQILILDEPTSGLDPNQIVEVRKVIKEISKSKTIIFSTHIMQEVQALCDRVVIINKGKIVADDKLTLLLAGKSNKLIVEFQEDIDVEDIKKIEGVVEVIGITNNKCNVIAESGTDIRTRLFQYATEKKLSLIELKVEAYSIESLFKELTAQENEL